jgi:hypothetical protein
MKPGHIAQDNQQVPQERVSLHQPFRSDDWSIH